MKNRISALNKTLLALYAILGAVLTLFFAVAFYCGAEVSAFGYAFKLADGIWSRLATAVAALVLLYWSYRILLIAFNVKGSKDHSSVSISNTENGDVRISLQAMDSLVKRAIGDMSGIASIKTNVLSNDDSISVEVSMALESDVHIPNTTMLLQRTVKNFIEEYSGIAVRDVTVVVTSVADPIVVPKQLAIETLPKKRETELEKEQEEPAQAAAATESEPEPVKEPEPETEPAMETAAEPVKEPEAEPVKEVQPVNEPEAEPAKEPEPEAVKEPETQSDDEPEQACEEPAREEEPARDDFLLSDSLPNFDSFLDQTENVDYNFSQSASDGEANYYSPYEKPVDEKTDEDKK